MPMKIRDVQVATAFIIHGYIRDSDSKADVTEQAALAECLEAIESEVSDWAEGLPGNRNQHALPGIGDDLNALDPAKLSVGLNCERTPFNIANAITDLAQELADLNGEDLALKALTAASTAVTARAGVAATVAAEGSFA